MSEEGTGNKIADRDLLPDLNLKSAASSIAEARARLELRQSVGKELRSAIKHILEAQEKLEGHGSVAEMRLDLLEAIRLIGAVEALLKGSGVGADAERQDSTDLDHGASRPARRRGEAPRPQAQSATADFSFAADNDLSSERDSRAEPPAPRNQLSALAAGHPPAPEATPDHALAGDNSGSSIAESPASVPPHPGTISSRLSEGGGGDLQNRRAYRRLAATYAIQLQPPYNGFSNSDLTQLPISGVTLNLSRGGMLAQIDQGTLRHGRYLIRFLGAGKNVRPEIMWGRVRRSRAADDGWEVGIEFDSPLEILRP